jgi:hypothetical protein
VGGEPITDRAAACDEGKDTAVASGWRRARGGRLPVECAPLSTDERSQQIRDLLADVRDLRLTLTADLAAAASALDAGAPAIAGDIIDGDRDELRALQRRTDSRLTGLRRLAVPTHDTPRWRRRALMALPAAPLVGAMAVAAAAATGTLPMPGAHHDVVRPNSIQTASVPVNSTFHAFESVVDGDPSASQLLAAAQALHAQIAAMLASAPNNPARAAEIAQLLQLEQQLLMSKEPPGTSIVLAASRRLVAQLIDIAPASVPGSLRADVPAPTPAASARPAGQSTSPEAWPTTRTSSSPTSAHSPAPSPTSTSTSTSAGSTNPPLPSFGG